MIFKSSAGLTAPDCMHSPHFQPDSGEPALSVIRKKMQAEPSEEPLLDRGSQSRERGRSGYVDTISISKALPWSRQITSQELVSFFITIL